MSLLSEVIQKQRTAYIGRSVSILLFSFLFFPVPTVILFVAYLVGVKVFKIKHMTLWFMLFGGVGLVLYFIFDNKVLEYIVNDLLYPMKGILNLLVSLFPENLFKMNANLIVNFSFWTFLKPKPYQFLFVIIIVGVTMFFTKTSADVLQENAHKEKQRKNKINKNKYIDLESRQHTLAVGTTGTGKTSIAANYIEQCIKNNGFSINFCGKGDESEFSLYDIVTRLCAKYNRKLLLINQTSIEKSMPYNPFIGATATQVKDMLANMGIWSEDYYKNLASRYWQTMAQILIDNEVIVNFKTLTIYSDWRVLYSLLRESYDNGIYGLEKFERYEKIIVNKHGTGEEAKITPTESSIQAGIANSRFAIIAEGDGSRLFSEGKGWNMEVAYKENAVVLVLMNDFKYTDFARSLGVLAIDDIKNLIGSLQKEKAHNQPVFFFDEISVYIDSTIIGLLNRSRSAGIKCILGTQSLADVDNVDENLTKQIIENCNDYIIMRLNEAEDAERMAKTIGTRKAIEQTRRSSSNEFTGDSSNKVVEEFVVHPQDIKELKNHTGYYYSKNKPHEVIKFKTRFIDLSNK